MYLVSSIPLPESVGATPTVILDAQGGELATLQPEASREDIDLAELPPHVINAVLAAEDANFRKHRGVSVMGIFRAALRNVSAREVTQGGSTISQQYIKTVTQDDEQTYLRKVREAALAVKLENKYSKNQILEFYLESIYWGRGAYGIEAAAKAYYGKPARKLNVREAALLAGLIAAPSAYDPAENRLGARQRYLYVLGRMAENGWLAQEKVPAFSRSLPKTRKARPVVFKKAPYFLEMVRKELEYKVRDRDVFGGLIVTTTLQRGVQRKAEESYAESFVQSGIKPGGALVAIDNSTGGIAAIVGGKNYARSQLNLALAKRQPGSTFKPFALAAWIAEGKSPESYFEGPSQITFSVDELNDKLGITSTPEEWEPENFEGADFGKLSLREATWSSVNTVYAQVVLEVGPNKMRKMAEQAGIGRVVPFAKASKLSPTPSLVLGTSEVTPLELAQSFSTFANAGTFRKAHTVAEVRSGGEVIYRTPAKGKGAINSNVALGVTDVLRGVVESGSGAAADIGRPAAGKTGTTQNNADAWFAGYTPQYTAVVWMGNVSNNKPMEGEYTGGSIPAETWGDFMGSVHENLPIEDFEEPSLDGLEVVGPTPPACAEDEEESENPEGDTVCVSTEPTETEAPATEASEEPSPTPSPTPEPEPTPSPVPEPEPEPEPTKAPKPSPSPKPPKPSPTPEVTPSPEAGTTGGGTKDDQDAATAAG